MAKLSRARSPGAANSSQIHAGVSGFWRLSARQDGLSRSDRAILIGRWMALILAGSLAVTAGRLSEGGTLALLSVGAVYLVAVEVLSREKRRLDQLVGPVCPLVDLALIGWATAQLGISLFGLNYVVILVTAIRHGQRPTLLVGLASSLLYILIDASLDWPSIMRIDVLVQALTFVGASALAGYLAEITQMERREKEKQREVGKEKADRLFLVSHELRSPLAMIKGAVDLLLEGAPGPMTTQQHLFLTTISDQGERLISLVEDVLGTAQVEAGRLNLKIAFVDVRVPVRSAVQSFRPLAAKKGQQVHLDYPQVLPKVCADSYWIQQVVVNLLSNASKHTSERGHIYVSIADNQYHVLVSVTDDGAGISHEDRERMFDPYVRGGDPSIPGTGLGLAIVQHVVDKHGGKVLVDTTLGRGSTFLFTLPKEDLAATHPKENSRS